eukprot:5716095-Amphidinium_carterae.4
MFNLRQCFRSKDVAKTKEFNFQSVRSWGNSSTRLSEGDSIFLTESASSVSRSGLPTKCLICQVLGGLRQQPTPHNPPAILLATTTGGAALGGFWAEIFGVFEFE